jgi:anti-sigma B factor antagonist
MEITAATSAEFEDLAAPYLDSASGLIIDLSGVKFISSSGLGQLVRFGRSLGARGAPLVLAGGRRSVMRLLQTVGLDSVMPMFGSVDEASRHVTANLPDPG